MEEMPLRAHGEATVRAEHTATGAAVMGLQALHVRRAENCVRDANAGPSQIDEDNVSVDV